MPEKDYHVFISYSSIDSEPAFALLQVLEKNGLRCWIAPRDIPQGAQWADEIDNAIQAARAFVVVISSNSMKSKQVPKEVALAVSACEGIFPFRIDDTELRGSFRYYLSDYQFVDAVQQREIRMQELAESIRSALNLPALPDPEPPQTDQTANGQAPAEAPSPAGQATPAPEAPGSAAQTGKSAPASGPAAKKAAGKRPKKLWRVLRVILIVVGVLVLCFIGLVIREMVSMSKSSHQAASSTASTQSDETAAAVPETESAPEPVPEPEPEPASETGDSLEVSPLFGGWKLIETRDQGKRAAYFNISSFYVCVDGQVYTSRSEFFRQAAAKEYPKLLWTEDGLNFTEVFSPTRNAEAYDISATCFLMDDFDGTIPAEKDAAPPEYVPVDVDSIDPAAATFASCYPERFLAVHVTGSYQESPVSVLDVDTWLIYDQQGPVLGSNLLPTLTGTWEDTLGNSWHFWPGTEDMAFSLTSSDGKKYTGKYINDTYGDPDKDDFFEHITFAFEEFYMFDNAIVRYDGAVLYLLDDNGTKFIMTRTGIK